MLKNNESVIEQLEPKSVKTQGVLNDQFGVILALVFLKYEVRFLI